MKVKVNKGLLRMLITGAKRAAHYAQPHLSKFKVGVVIYADHHIYLGCNIEFDNYSNTLHAEEVALGDAIVHGAKEIKAIAVYTQDKKVWFPCGMCRQSLFEKCGKDTPIIACNDKKYEVKTIGSLLPGGFKLG